MLCAVLPIAVSDTTQRTVDSRVGPGVPQDLDSNGALLIWRKGSALARPAGLEVALASDLVVGAGLTDIHLPDATEQSKEKSDCYNILWHNKMTFEVNPNKINRLRRTK